MTKTYVLGGGCFWCLDSVYSQFKGITDVTVGYAGGALANPDYETVCGGHTGHAEVVSVSFDDAQIPPSVVLDLFFTMHDPRQLNRQGNDIGTQYRSCMLYTDAAQREEFEAAVARAAELWDGLIVTELAPLETFWVGEDYHQDFFAKNPNQGYCVATINPKLAKTRAKFGEYTRH